MNNEFFEVDILGILRYDEIIFFHDEVQLCTCIDENERKYLAVRIGDGSSWLLVNMSESRLDLFRHSFISARECFTFPESGRIIMSICGKGKLYDPEEIPEDKLPDENFFADTMTLYQNAFHGMVIEESNADDTYTVTRNDDGSFDFIESSKYKQATESLSTMFDGMIEEDNEEEEIDNE